MRRAPHENVATVLVDPCVLEDLELELMALDMAVWPVRTAPICEDGPRRAFQIRRRLLMAQRGGWDLAADAGVDRIRAVVSPQTRTPSPSRNTSTSPGETPSVIAQR